MPKEKEHSAVCAVIGAGHAGVNFAFTLRKEGWEGEIMLYDADPLLPYHRPPLSKSYLCSEADVEKYALKSAASYEKAGIVLHLGMRVVEISPEERYIKLDDGQIQHYDRLVLATGARPLLPPIPGVDQSDRVFTLRTATDIEQIRKALAGNTQKQIVVIGGGFIGLEVAASLRKLGAQVTVLEREKRILARVTAPEVSRFFQELHRENGVTVHTGKQVTVIESMETGDTVICSDGSRFPADFIIVGVGIQVNLELARAAGLSIENGIVVDNTARTSDPYIYAIGDCTFHYNAHYDRYIRLECVQNAVDQAKIAAAAIGGKEVSYDSLPWFWSDQYDVKLQMVGLSEGYDQAVVRRETGDQYKFSIWYFSGDKLLAVDAVNDARAYVLGTKWIKVGKTIHDRGRLRDAAFDLKQFS